MGTLCNLTVIVLDDVDNSSPHWIYLIGCNAWVLLELFNAGDTGCSSSDYRGVNLPTYVHNLRACGFDIEGSEMPQGNRFPEVQMQYVLRSKIIIAEVE